MSLWMPPQGDCAVLGDLSSMGGCDFRRLLKGSEGLG